MVAIAEVIDIGQGGGEIVPQKVKKALAEFNLPDDRSLLIGWTQDRFEDGARSFFLAGLGLIKLHLTNRNAYSGILEQNFPHLNERTARNYRAYAEAMLNHPAFEAFQKERGGYSKALTVLRMCDEAEILEADDSGELLGYTMGQLAKMSIRTMQKALLRAREHEAQAVKKARAESEPLKLENASLREENEGLKAAMTEPDVQGAFKIIREAEKKFMEGAALLRKITPELLEREETVRNLVFVSADMLNRLRSQIVDAAQGALNRVLTAEGEE